MPEGLLAPSFWSRERYASFMTDLSHLEKVALVKSLEWPALTEIKRAPLGRRPKSL